MIPMQTIGNRNSRNKRNISISGNLALFLISKSVIINVIGISKLLHLCTVLCVPKWVITWAFRRKHLRCKFGFVFFFLLFFCIQIQNTVPLQVYNSEVCTGCSCKRQYRSYGDSLFLVCCF